MHVIAKRTLIEFCNRLPAAEQGSAKTAMTAWYTVTMGADWSNFADVKATFNTADWVGNAKVVFDIGGNKYRIVGLIGFRSKRVWVLFVGSHREYDGISVADL
jgi:mRNA interferase HigB